MFSYNQNLNTTEEFFEQNQMQCHDRIVVVGNGFDIRAGLKSKFEDFIFFVVYGCALYNYKNTLNIDNVFNTIKETLQADKTSLPFQLRLHKDLDEQLLNDCHLFSANKLGKFLLQNIFSKDFYTFINLVHQPCMNPDISMEDQEDYLDYVQYVLKFVYGLTKRIPTTIGNDKSHFWNFLKENSENKNVETFVSHAQYVFKANRNKLNLWLDVESVIEMIVTESLDLKNKYNFSKKIPRDAVSIKSYLDGLKLFEELFAKYLKLAVNVLDRTAPKFTDFFNNIKTSYKDSLEKRSHFRIKNIDISEPSIVLNYNYSSVAEELFNRNDRSPKMYYINGALEIDDDTKVEEIGTNIVIGYTSNNDNVPKELFPFEKASRRIIKNTQYVDINTLVDEKIYSGMHNSDGQDLYFDLVIIGHSCGLADSDILKPLLSSKYLKTAVVLCYSVEDMIPIYNNIKKMLDPKDFSNLMKFSPDKIINNLYFAVDINTTREQREP